MEKLKLFLNKTGNVVGRRNKWVKSILFRTTIFSWSLIIVTLIVILVAILPLEKKIAENRMHLEAKYITNSIERNIAASLTEGKIDLAAKYCSIIIKNHIHISYIIIIHPGKYALSVTGKEWSIDTSRQNLEKLEAELGEDKFIYNSQMNQNIFNSALPIEYGALDIGWIYTGLNSDYYTKDIDRIYFRLLWIAVLSVVMGFAVSLFFSHKITNPIKQLDDVTKRVAAGDFSAKAIMSTGDELESLSKSFNVMTANLKTSQEELVNSRKFADNIIKSMANSLIVLNVDITIKTVNKTTVDMLGYTEDELVNMNINKIFQDEDGRGLSIYSLIRKGFLLNVPNYYRAKSGEKIPVSFSGAVMYDDYNNIQGIVCVAQDITERKEAEEALIKAHDELEIRVYERTHELEKANNALQVEINERKKAESKLKGSLTEKEVLLKEIHHRVKNNLQVISSLLYLNSRKITDDKALSLFKDSQNRVKSIALVHERLYQSKDLGKIDLQDYIERLTNDLFSSYGINREVIKSSIKINNIKIGIDNAVSCGLIINELVSNSLKYAFPNDKQGNINVNGIINKNIITIVVEDDGIGIPYGFDIVKADSLGLQLVNSLVYQLGGSIEHERTNGTKFKIVFTENMTEV